MKLFFLLVTACVLSVASAAQTTIATDSNTVYQNKEGKVLTPAEAKELMKSKFSMKQDIVDGKKVITIIPQTDAAVDKINAQIKAFREGLIGKPIRSFKLTDLNNNKWNSKSLKGQVVVMNFWFIGCKPCVQEMPMLNEVVAAYKDKSVTFLAPGLDREEPVKKFLNQYKFDYNIVALAGDYADELKIENFPTHIVIDKQGVIRQVFVGYSDDINKKLKEEIEKLL